MNVDILWSKILSQIKDEITSISYQTWFSETKLHELKDGKAYIIVPMPIHKKHLQDNYYDIISSKLDNLTDSSYELNFLLEEELSTLIVEKEMKNEQDVVEKKSNNYNFNVNSNLKSNYNFENFIVGNSNRFAHAAALSVAENPGKIYNPLFLFGNSGLGKTHLMHAIGNYIVETTNKKVLYVTSEQFREEFVKANRKDDNGTNFNYVDFFKDKYRNIDVLIIDDIQFLANATQSQQEFFHTFNELHQEGKQIIISSDRSPDDLKLLEERLRTRFSWGLTVNIYPPDYELRLEILKKKLSVHELARPVDNEVLEYIANNCTSDVRKLEGALNRLFAYTTMFNKEVINLEVATEALKGHLNSYGYVKNNIQKIQSIVADYYQIDVADMKSKKRTNKIAFPRQIAMYLSRIMTDESFPRIGIEFGGKDHSTIIHACEKIEEDMKEDKNLETIINTLKQKIK